MSTSSNEAENPDRQHASQALFSIEQAQKVVLRHSIDNGIVLTAWGIIFLLDMILFNIAYVIGSVLPGVVSVICVNSLFMLWRLWYGQKVPIRLRKALTNRIIFWWSFYYVALIGFGVGGWIMFIGSYPPFWFSFLGLLGAAPLLISARQQWRRSQQAQ